jgi:hypothetical protein
MCYHVMSRGQNHQRIFGDDDDRRQSVLFLFDELRCCGLLVRISHLALAIPDRE